MPPKLCVFCSTPIDNRTKHKGRFYVTIPNARPRPRGHYAHDTCERRRVALHSLPVPTLSGSLTPNKKD